MHTPYADMSVRPIESPSVPSECAAGIAPRPATSTAPIGARRGIYCGPRWAGAPQA